MRVHVHQPRRGLHLRVGYRLGFTELARLRTTAELNDRYNRTEPPQDRRADVLGMGTSAAIALSHDDAEAIIGVRSSTATAWGAACRDGEMVRKPTLPSRTRPKLCQPSRTHRGFHRSERWNRRGGAGGGDGLVAGDDDAPPTACSSSPSLSARSRPARPPASRSRDRVGSSVDQSPSSGVDAPSVARDRREGPKHGCPRRASLGVLPIGIEPGSWLSQGG
jgi:hypothetical protein